MELKNILLGFVILCLLFFGIPIRIPKGEVDDLEESFRVYLTQFNKSYETNQTEYLSRFANFKESLRYIKELNRNRTSGSAYYGLNKYSDLSRTEFQDKHLQNRVNFNDTQHYKVNNGSRWKRAILGLPSKVDWREKGVINAIRNQNICGACWAFSTVSTVESMDALKKGSLQTLSVQEVIDCAKNGNHGCEGGDSCTLAQWLALSKTKIEPEKLYPYNHVTQTCKLKGSEDGVQVSSFTCDNFVSSEDGLVAKLANHGPVAVAVNAINWQFYLGGTIQFHCNGAPTMLNHAVQIVGYDKMASVPHYIARNSWGVEFGDKGYLYLAMGSNVCGLANEVVSLDVL